MRAFLCLFPVVAVGIPAQTVHVVGPGGPSPIGSALASAAPGDILHVLPGTYAPFTVTRGCTIRALIPGTVDIVDSSSLYQVTIQAPAGEVVHLVGLDLPFSPSGGVVLAINGGRATLEACVMSNQYGTPLVIQGASVHMQRCTVTASNQFGFNPAMRGSSSYITAIDSTFFGSPNPLTFNYACSPGMVLTATTLHASHCRIQSGLSTISGGAPGLHTNGGEVWLSDSTVVGIGFSCPIVGGPIHADRCVLLPALPSCTAPPSGNLLGVSRSQALQNGAAFSLNFRTIPNGYVAIFASHDLATLSIPGLHAQTQWIGPGVINLGAVPADAQGNASATWNLPAGAWLVDQRLWFQGLTGFALPLQLSPVAGGVIR